MSKWKLSDVIALGVAKTASENCSLKIALAVKRFLSLVGFGKFADEPFVLLVPPGSGLGDVNRVPLSNIEGPIPEDLKLHWNVAFEFSVGGQTYTNTLALASIPRRMCDYGDLVNSLAQFIRELTQVGENQQLPQIIGSAEGLALYWAMSFGYPYPLTEALPPAPPVKPVEAAPYEPLVSPVGEQDADENQYGGMPGSELYHKGDLVKEARGVFKKATKPSPFGQPYTFWVLVSPAA